jgi:HTH-type transcriptional regulator/antitoxin MqsA
MQRSGFADESYDRVTAAGDALVRVAKKSNPPEVRIIREKLGLTQAEAGRVFGGGVNAFSRYERGAAKPSPTIRKLLKVVEHHPELIEEIAEISWIERLG